MMNLLEVKNLYKNYGSNNILKNVSLNVPKGVLFALLGPNGAGKTTLLKSILNITSIVSGSIKICDIDKNNFRSHKKVAYFPEKFTFYPYYTVKGVLKFYGKMYGVSSKDLTEKISEVVKKCQIEEILDKKLGKISKGQLQRTGIASMLMSEAELFIFDEPFSGLDPIGIKDLREIFFSLKERGKTVFINTHIIAEIEKFIDYVAIIDRGEIKFSGKVEDFSKDNNLEEAFYQLIKGGDHE